jgi:hypothetical protein
MAKGSDGRPFGQPCGSVATTSRPWVPPTASRRASSSKQQQSSAVPAVASTATTRDSRVNTIASLSSSVNQKDESGATKTARTTSFLAAFSGLREGHSAPPYGSAEDDVPTSAEYAADMR